MRSGFVREDRIQALAVEIARFHNGASIVDTPFSPKIARHTFNDIRLIRNLVLKEFGAARKREIDQAIDWSNDFLSDHASRLRMRVKLGFQRDVHGDLHSGNIFLYRSPILFDCIEFNDRFRQIDLLYELAFLCMDLEFFGMENLSEVFMKSYQEIIQCVDGIEDELIFNYFKCLRANVRAKVHAMNILQNYDRDEAKIHLFELKKYLSLMKWYLGK